MKARFTKVLVMVLAVAMCLGMSVCAEESPSGGTVFNVRGIYKAYDKNGQDVTGKISLVNIEESGMHEKFQPAADEIQTEAGLKAALGADWSPNLIVADVKYTKVEGDVEFPVTMTVNMTGVTAGTKVYVLCWNGSSWEKIEAVAGEGTITFTINEPSLLAFVVDKTTLTTTAVSPKTSVSYSTVIALFGIAAVVAVCGLKKKSVLR